MEITLTNNCPVFGRAFYNVIVRWWLPEGFTVEGKRTVVLEHNTSHHREPQKDVHVVVKAGECVEAINRVVLEVTADGRPTTCYVPLQLLG